MTRHITTAGLILVPRGTTRAKVFEQAYGEMCEQAGGEVNVLFFSVEPNELPVPAALNGAKQ